MTPEEITLKNVLLTLADCSKLKLLGLVIVSWFYFQKDVHYKTYLQRMRLDKPNSFKDLIYKKLFKFILRKSVRAHSLPVLPS